MILYSSIDIGSVVVNKPLITTADVDFTVLFTELSSFVSLSGAVGKEVSTGIKAKIESLKIFGDSGKGSYTV